VLASAVRDLLTDGRRKAARDLDIAFTFDSADAPSIPAARTFATGILQRGHARTSWHCEQRMPGEVLDDLARLAREVPAEPGRPVSPSRTALPQEPPSSPSVRRRLLGAAEEEGGVARERERLLRESPRRTRAAGGRKIAREPPPPPPAPSAAPPRRRGGRAARALLPRQE